MRLFDLAINPQMLIWAHSLEIITQYIYQCYGLVCTQSFSDKALRVKHLTVTPDITLRDLVPSTHGILQHIRRCCIQAGYLWRLAQSEIEIPDPKLWGWKLGVNTPKLFRTTLARSRNV